MRLPEREKNVAVFFDEWESLLPHTRGGGPVVRRIRGDPGSLDGQVILIPLHAPPIDMRQAARLARGVLCGGRAGCEVEFAPPP